MINLLPDETKKQIRAARTNTVLIKYLIFLGLAAVFLSLVCIAVYFFLVNNRSATMATPKNAQISSATSYASVKAQADTLRTNLSTSKNILDQQISYSDIITGIGTALPSGVIIDTISLKDNTIGTPITLQAHAHSTEDTQKLKDNFQKSSLFSNFTVQSTKTGQSDLSGYPVTIIFNLTVNKGTAK